MIVGLLLGTLIGFLTNVPVGPINAAVVVHGLKERFSRGMAVGVGAAFMDLVYCSAAMFGVAVIGDHPVVSLLLELAAFVLLFVLGIKSLRTRRTLDDLQSAEARVEQRLSRRFRLHAPFLLGVVLYLANPTFLPYWIGVSGLLQRYGMLVPSTLTNLAFAFGAGIGGVLWFYLILVVLLRRRKALTPAVINSIYRFSGVTLLGFGTYLGYRLLVLTNWMPLLRLLSVAF